MRSRKWSLGVCLAFLLAVLALGGCGGGSNNGPKPNPNPAPQPQVGVLEKWKGTWKSFSAFMDDDAMKPVWSEVAKSAPGYTANGVKSFFEEMYGVGFDGLKVEGSTVTFLNSQDVSVGALVYASKGTAKRKIEMAGQTMEVEWHLFEAPVESGATPQEGESFDPKKACKYMALFPPHRDSEGSMLHWHMRYGSSSLEALIGDPKSLWWPTLCAPDTKVADVAKDQLGEAKMLAAMLPKPLKEWDGTWVSAYEFARDAKMTPAYEAIAAAAQKGLDDKKVRNYTSAEVRAFFEAFFKTDFDRLVVTDGTKVEYKKADGSVVATVNAAYKNDGFVRSGWAVWIDGSEAGYKNVVGTHPHGEGAGKHWHMVYGDDSPEALLAKKLKDGANVWHPTFFDPKENTVDAFAASWLKNAERQAKRLPEKK